MLKTKRKGMTLIEIIVALAVSAIMSLLLVEIMSCVNAMMRATSRLNKRLAHESKYADNLITADNVGAFDASNCTADIIFNGKTISGVNCTEYLTHHYTDPSDLSTKETGANYRFMVFNATPGHSADAPDFFKIELILTEDLLTADQLTSIEIAATGGFYDPRQVTNTSVITSLTPVTSLAADDRIMASEYAMIKNTGKNQKVLEVYVPVDEHNANGKINIKLHKDMVDKTYHQHFDDYCFFNATLDYCTWVTNPGGTKVTFYSGAKFGFDGKSIIIDETIDPNVGVVKPITTTT